MGEFIILVGRGIAVVRLSLSWKRFRGCFNVKRPKELYEYNFLTGPRQGTSFALQIKKIFRDVRTRRASFFISVLRANSLNLEAVPAVS